MLHDVLNQHYVEFKECTVNKNKWWARADLNPT